MVSSNSSLGENDYCPSRTRLCSHEGGPGEEAEVWRKPPWLYCYNSMLYNVHLKIGVFWLNRSLPSLRSFSLSSWHGFSVLILFLLVLLLCLWLHDVFFFISFLNFFSPESIKYWVAKPEEVISLNLSLKLLQLTLVTKTVKTLSYCCNCR